MKQIKISILVENTVYSSPFKAEHGWSVLIETPDWSVLWDTGQSSLFLENAQIMDIDLRKINKVVLSHGHYDHTGGLPALLSLYPQIPVHAHPDVFKKRYYVTSKKCSREIGIPKELIKHTDKFCLSKEPQELFPGCITTGEIPRLYSIEDNLTSFYNDPEGMELDLLLDDQTLILNTSEGLAVILGCCHAGLANTFEHISELTGEHHFNLVMGGMHLSGASDKVIRETLDVLRKFHIKKIGAAHCTGHRGAIALEQAFPGMIFPCSVGTTLKLTLP
ncbi:MBL fold metallo-hydrolase [Phosphitispora sp. TUW77]|uniref:MBL fold metallo-hydrolase n=1 Tax=Phosphitispora sp. TUW77 TaxID=3152361 RepID=UPI003AB654B7